MFYLFPAPVEITTTVIMIFFASWKLAFMWVPANPPKVIIVLAVLFLYKNAWKVLLKSSLLL
jgi:hypothetical protein